MAYLASEAIVERLRELLSEAAGSLRPIASNTYTHDLVSGLDVNEEARRSLPRPSVDASISGIRRSAASPPLTGNLAIYDFDLEVRVVVPLTAPKLVDPDAYDAAKAAIVKSADIIAQSLSWPPNLTTTTGGTATGLLGLALVASSISARNTANEAGGVLEAKHSFKGIARSAPAV